jgi:branched-chain amino acid aminotransferase
LDVHPIVSLNGSLAPLAEAHLSPLDAGFLLGDGLFETMRVYAASGKGDGDRGDRVLVPVPGRVLDLDRHLARLVASARAFRLALPPTADLQRAVEALIERNAVGDGACRLTVSRGLRAPVLGLPGKPSEVSDPTVFAYTTPLPSPSGPVALVTSTVRIDATSPLAGHKTTSFLPYLWARQEALDRGADEALLLNHAGRVAECAAANIFIVRGRQVLTPPLADGCLPGIVRAVVLDLAGHLGLTAAEHPLTPADLLAADEVFLTNSLRELTPASSLDGRPLPAPTPLTALLLDAYRERAHAR